MNLALADAPNAAICSTLQQLTPEHARLVALRVQGHSWSKCAAHMGIDRTTVLRWRWENPAIDAAVMEESLDYLAASKHRLAALQEQADNAIAEGLTATKLVGLAAVEVPDHLARLAAAKMAKQPFEKSTPSSVTVSSHVAVGGPGERALPATSGARVVDAVAEPDDFSDLNLPDRREEAR